ncbi:hypothetical protein JYT71_01130 [Acidimicrobiaceae bacterium AH-315-P05]|nr:hypothetical protein [Acidimicrobiaceae bacterium AH-315-P05]
MTSAVLTPSAFVGDPDVARLHSFFLPQHQFNGDTRWTFGTSLKSAYVNCFDFMNHSPLVQLWRDPAGDVQAVSRLGLGPGEWFYQLSPRWRSRDQARVIVKQADAAFELLSDHESWTTACYRSKTAEIDLLRELGYVEDGESEVFMTRDLDEPIKHASSSAGIEIGLLDQTSATQVAERGLAQVDAFSDGNPTTEAVAWISRSLPHQLSYGRPDRFPHVVAVDHHGSILSFADVYFDRANRIGEFEPVGSRKSARRRGLANAVLLRGLQEMQSAGMRQAIVRTGIDNPAAIASYEAVGFGTVDHLIRFRKQRMTADLVDDRR